VLNRFSFVKKNYLGKVTLHKFSCRAVPCCAADPAQCVFWFVSDPWHDRHIWLRWRDPASTGFAIFLPGNRLAKLSLPTNLLPVSNYLATTITLPLSKAYSDSFELFL